MAFNFNKVSAGTKSYLLAFAGLIAPLLIPTIGQAAVGNQSLQTHWQFDRGSGSTALDTRGKFDGAIEGSYSWTTGIEGGALQLQGGHVETAATDAFNNRSFTISMWVKPTRLQTPEVFASVGSNLESCASGWAFGHTAKAFEFQHCDAGDVMHEITDRSWDMVEANEWQHLAVVMKDVRTISFYLNGNLLSRSPAFSLQHSPTHVLRLGNQKNGQKPFHGSIDDVRYYDRALSQQAIRRLATLGSRPVSANEADILQQLEFSLQQLQSLLSRVQ